MKNKKMTGKQIKFIINMISFGVFCFSYLYLYEGYNKKTEDTYLQAEMVKAQIKDREKKLSEEDEVELKIPELKEQKQAILNSFPVHIEEEDNFMFIEQMEKNLNVKTSAINMTENSLFYTTILPAQGTGGASSGSGGEESNTNASTEGQAFMTAEVNTLSMSFLTNYQGFKNLVEYIKYYPENTAIDNVAVSYDNTTGALAGSLSLRRYLLTGTGKEYKAPSIDGIEIGTENIFGTRGKKNSSPEQSDDQQSGD